MSLKCGFDRTLEYKLHYDIKLLYMLYMFSDVLKCEIFLHSIKKGRFSHSTKYEKEKKILKESGANLWEIEVNSWNFSSSFPRVKFAKKNFLPI